MMGSGNDGPGGYPAGLLLILIQLSRRPTNTIRSASHIEQQHQYQPCYSFFKQEMLLEVSCFPLHFGRKTAFFLSFFFLSRSECTLSVMESLPFSCSKCTSNAIKQASKFWTLVATCMIYDNTREMSPYLLPSPYLGHELTYKSVVICKLNLQQFTLKWSTPIKKYTQVCKKSHLTKEMV